VKKGDRKTLYNIFFFILVVFVGKGSGQGGNRMEAKNKENK